MPSMTEQASRPSGAASAYAKSWGVHPNYIVTLTVSGDGGDSFEISNSVEETLAIQMGAEWAAPFENVAQDALKQAANRSGVSGRTQAMAGLGATAFGASIRPKALSALVWQSSTPMELTIPFTLVATEDPRKDIRDKVVSLLKLCAPSEGPAGMLMAPGPTLMSAAAGPSGRKISLKIGQFITLEPCVVKDVSVQFDNVIGEDAIPLRAKVSVRITSWYACFTTQEIDKMFK